jgi:hypothetical protein
MIRHGASIAEISEVLRHRSQSTTAVYAQVSFEVLTDFDRFNPYQDLVGLFGHMFGEVIWHKLRRLGSVSP